MLSLPIIEKPFYSVVIEILSFRQKKPILLYIKGYAKNALLIVKLSYIDNDLHKNI